MSNINQHFKTLREKTKFKLKKKGGMAGLTLILLLLVSAIAYYLVTKSDDTDPPGTEHFAHLKGRRWCPGAAAHEE